MFFLTSLLLHVGPPPLGPIWTAWPTAPVVQVALAATACLYWLGWERLRRRGHGRVMPRWRGWSFAGGMVALTLALASPIAAYDETLFFMHMIQHLLLLLVAPPLLLLGAPLAPLLWGLPGAVRRRLGRWLVAGQPLARLGTFLTLPVVAAGAYVVTIAVWHVPVLFDAAQGRTLTHDLEHAMFFGTALLYWWPVVHPGGGRRRLSYAAAIPYLLPPFLEGTLIGALITFADRPLYQTYVGLAPTWGFSTLTDQQLGGLIMWVPGGMFFLIPVIGLLALLLNQEERNAQRAATDGRL